MEFYEKLKQALESDYFNELLVGSDLNEEVKRIYVSKCLNYLISTRDFDNFNYFINHFYQGTFPFKYFSEKKNLSPEQAQSIIYENYIRNGFLFHITPNYNVDKILENGLQTLNDKYKCDAFEKSSILEQTYRLIKTRNKNKHINGKELFIRPNLISIPGAEKMTEDRFNTVYLSSNLEYIYAQGVYGNYGEFADGFVQELFHAFQHNEDLTNVPKDELKQKINNIICNSGAEIYDNEIKIILDYFDTFFEEEQSITNPQKAILMVPNKCIKSNSRYFKLLYKENYLNLPVEDIIDLSDGEIENQGSIAPENIIAITPQKDSSLQVKRLIKK